MIADVLLPLAVDQVYSYHIPSSLKAQEGYFVTIPFGRQTCIGVIWALRPPDPSSPPLKEIEALPHIPPLPPDIRNFIDWVARWTLAPKGMVLRMAIRSPCKAKPEIERWGISLAHNPPSFKCTPQRRNALEVAARQTSWDKAELAKAVPCSLAVIEGLIATKALLRTPLPPITPHTLNPSYHPPLLEREQQKAADILRQRVQEQAFCVTLLEGITGSGKTEVYFEAIAQALENKQQILILVPEIALTSQFIDRFEKRFGGPPLLWHSDLSDRKRRYIWEGVAKGDVKVVVGARSALFLPFSHLGLILVDEEHEGAYKQEEGVLYHARDMAVVRAKFSHVPLILASATPSLETRVNALQGRYHHLRLTHRYAGRTLPDIRLINLRNYPLKKGTSLSPPLLDALQATLTQGEQSLLFLNRRGYAPLTLCQACGHRFQCPHCTAWLVDHRSRKILMCHQCGHVQRQPRACPACHDKDHLIAHGPGIERLQEEVQAAFPQARILTLSSDLTRSSHALWTEMQKIAQGNYDILLGTQLVAKGHHFPLLTLVGVVDGDMGLSQNDPRAVERTFQLLQQVTGRAGRGDKPGRALIQTYHVDHPMILTLLSGDQERFYEEETQIRAHARLPPFGRLAAVIIKGRDKAATQDYAQKLARMAHALPKGEKWTLAPMGQWAQEGEMQLLGPAEAPIARVRGWYRFRLLLKAPRTCDVQGFLRAWLSTMRPLGQRFKLHIDIDPQSFL